jgi:flagellar FliL protein
MPQILTSVFVLVVVLIQCAAAYVLLPSTDDLQAWAKDRHQQQPEVLRSADDSLEKPLFLKDERPTKEVDLGDFSITAYQPLASTTLRIDFHLWAAVCEESLSEFENQWERNENRIREQVIVTVRGCEVTDLTDAGWGLLKRKILDGTNRLLGRPLVQDVVFSEFAFVEQ